MNYDFTSIIDRRGKDALAVDNTGSDQTEFSPIPMWVADMNFATSPAIVRAMEERIQHPVFGYFEPAEEYYDSIIRWQEKRNGATGLKKENIGYENGVLGGVISALNILCSRGDNVLVHSPIYIGFTRSLKNNGYNIVHSELKKDENGVYRMDFEDMEKKIVEQNIHTLLLSSPHNPTGRVWERWELEQMTELCVKHDVYMICDEIWSDLIRPGFTHTPLQLVSDEARNRTIALYAPSKTFNLAGLVGSYHIIYNQRLNDRVRKEASLSHYNSMNVLSQHALIGAYRPESEAWLEELLTVLNDNMEYAYHFIKEHFEGVDITMPEGTYMLYLDCAKWLEAHEKTLDELLQAGMDVGVIWQDGRNFNGQTHIRMNLASPKSMIVEAFDRLRRYVF